MVDLRNPAARLDAFLHKLDNQPKDAGGFAAVCKMWDLGQEDPGHQQVAMVRLAEVQALGIEVRRRAQEIPKYGPMTLKNYERVETTLFNLLLVRSHQLNSILEPMDGRAWTCLEQLNELLDDENHFELEEGETNDLLTSVMKLILQAQSDPTLTDEQRRVIVRHLLDLQQALLNIDLVGPDRVEDAMAGLMGAWFLLGTKAAELAQSPVFASTLLLVDLLANTLGIVTGWQSIAASGSITLQLPSGGGGGSS